MPDRSGIPEAWPALLTREQACAYLGLSEGTFKAICPVAAVDLGVHLLRWRREELDRWVAGLPSRLVRAQASGEATPTPVVDAGEERRLSSIERARGRAGKPWTKKTPSPSSNASPARAAG